VVFVFLKYVEIKDEKGTLLTIIFEVFPSKVDYKNDYRAL